MQACQTFSTNVVVGVTAQNTLGVQGQYPLPRGIVNEQFKSVLANFAIKAAKTGALFDAEHVSMVADNLAHYQLQNVVVDPVMVAKGGAHLLTEQGIKTLKEKLLPQADVVTPNLPEAEILAGQKINSESDVKQAAIKIQQLGSPNVIIKGGHAQDATVSDYVRLADGTDYWLTSPRINTERTHGTGDTLSAAIVAYLAQGADLKTAINKAHKYLADIIQHPLYIGNGHGPLNHGSWKDDNDEI